MKLAGKAILVLALVGSGAAGGYYYGRSSSLPEARPSVVIDGPSSASPGETLKFTGERSASAQPLEWWIDGQLRTRGNTLYVDSAPNGPMILTVLAFGQGRSPEHAVASKLVNIGGTPPGPAPVPPGPPPGPPTPTPTPQATVKWAVVLYNPADPKANPKVGAIQRDGGLRTFLDSKGIKFRCLDATDDEVKSKFSGYFRRGIPTLPSLVLIGDSGDPPYADAMPETPAEFQALVRRYSP